MTYCEAMAQTHQQGHRPLWTLPAALLVPRVSLPASDPEIPKAQEMKRRAALYVNFCCACGAMFRSFIESPETYSKCRSTHWDDLKRYPIKEVHDTDPDT